MINFDLEILQKVSLYSFSHEKEIVNSILELRKGFTTHRDLIEDYRSSARLVSAYTIFYLPTNFPKLAYALQHLDQTFQNELRECDFIDVGTGPGTFILAFLDFVGKDYQGQIYGLDSSSLMLQQAQKCLDYFFPSLKNQTHFGYQWSLKESSSLSKKILFFGHSLNEMGGGKAKDWVLKVKPNYILFIEPGTPEVFQIILQLRREMQGLGYDVLYPCATLNSPCPVEKEIEQGEWCHQKMYQSYSPSIERLSQLLSLNRHSMPLITHIYRKASRESQGGTRPLQKEIEGRLFRVVRETKYSFQWELCREEQDGLHLILCEIMKKTLTKEMIKKLRTVAVGIKVKFIEEKMMPDKMLRIRLLTEESAEL